MNASASIQHRIVFAEPGRFAGWPANSGMWGWGNELLVGFSLADHAEKPVGHTYDPATSRQMFARSPDGGNTWRVEDAFERGITARAKDHAPGDRAAEPLACPGGFDFTHPDGAVTFRRVSEGAGAAHFYVTLDRGGRWQGPFALPLFGQTGILARTDYLVEDRHTLLAMLTAAKRDGREGRVGCARTRDGGATWDWVSWMDEEPAGAAICFAIMPATVRLTPDSLLSVVRRRHDRHSWLATYRSDDHARTWRRWAPAADDTGPSGNPAALVKLADGRVCVAYLVRSGDPSNPSRLCVRFTGNGGACWGEEIVLRSHDGAGGDAGYPRMVQRPDGALVLVYYYNHALRESPSHRYIAATIFDPAQWR